MEPSNLSPSLATLAAPHPPALRSLGLRLSPATFDRLEALREQLHGPTRAALLRVVVEAGLAAVEARLAQSPD